MRWFSRVKRRMFRKLIDIADTIDIWFKARYNVNMKQKALELSQDNIPLTKLDSTIGKALSIKRVEQ